MVSQKGSKWTEEWVESMKMWGRHADAVGVSLFALFLFFILYILYYISLCLGVPNERSLKCIDTKRTTLSGRNCAYEGGAGGGGATDNGNNGS